MNFEYTYKTSDGIRHVDAIRAKSQNDAFAALRARGIKPIRVERARPKGLGGWIAFALTSPLWIAVAVAVTATVVAVLLVWGRPTQNEVRREPAGETYLGFRAQAESIRAAHSEAFKSVDFELLRNYALIAHAKTLEKLEAEITKGKVVVANTRERLRALFGGAPSVFAGDPEGLAAAQALYGEVVAIVDADEAQVESDEAAIVLLSENRDKWKVVKGKVVFSDASLGKDFELFAQSVDAATARWHKDFGNTSVESNIIAVPGPKD